MVVRSSASVSAVGGAPGGTDTFASSTTPWPSKTIRTSVTTVTVTPPLPPKPTPPPSTKAEGEEDEEEETETEPLRTTLYGVHSEPAGATLCPFTLREALSTGRPYRFVGSQPCENGAISSALKPSTLAVLASRLPHELVTLGAPYTGWLTGCQADASISRGGAAADCTATTPPRTTSDEMVESTRGWEWRQPRYAAASLRAGMASSPLLQCAPRPRANGSNASAKLENAIKLIAICNNIATESPRYGAFSSPRAAEVMGVVVVACCS